MVLSLSSAGPKFVPVIITSRNPSGRTFKLTRGSPKVGRSIEFEITVISGMAYEVRSSEGCNVVCNADGRSQYVFATLSL